MFYLIIIVLSFLLTWRVRRYAIRKSIIDIPNGRSSHTIPTPRGGGLALVVSWFVGIIFIYIQDKLETSLFLALLAGIPLTLIGFADDVLNLKPTVRFLVQFFCAALALFFLGGLSSVNFGSWTVDPDLWTMDHGLWTYLLTSLAFIAIIWSINLFNFLDGIDGYIGSEIVFIGLADYLLTGDSLGLLLASATFGFLLWNWPKAKIFMGDVGSTLLGFTVAVLAIYHQNHHTASLWVWLILTSVFWFDATVTLIRRFVNKEKLSEAHRKHAYQRIVQAGFSHQKTTLWSIALNIVGFSFAWLAQQYSMYAILFLALDLLMLFGVLKYVDKRKAFEKDKSFTQRALRSAENAKNSHKS